MIRRRLYLQIYITIIASLALVVIISALSFWLVGGDRPNPQFREIIGQLVVKSLPSAELPHEAQDKALTDLVDGLDVDISMFAEDGTLISAYGYEFELPNDRERRRGWQHNDGGLGWILDLPDGRWLVAAFSDERGSSNPLPRLMLIIGSIALGIGLASYPLVRRITRRLEHLNNAVEQVGLGDLSVRVDVDGRDEIAGLANNFNHATEQIERLVTSHKTLLANASHELRTPLSRIRLGLEMYHESQDTKRLEGLRSDIEELDSLIEEILLMSRLDNSSAEAKLEEIDLSELINEEISHYEDASLAGHADVIFGDKRLLHRLVRNLVGNAFKHGKPPVKIELRQDNEYVILAISDNGPGIPVAEREKVFQRFYRGKDRQNVEGYGLGLSLVKQIVDMHDGAIGFKDDTGFTIEVKLPK